MAFFLVAEIRFAVVSRPNLVSSEFRIFFSAAERASFKVAAETVAVITR